MTRKAPAIRLIEIGRHRNHAMSRWKNRGGNGSLHPRASGLVNGRCAHRASRPMLKTIPSGMDGRREPPFSQPIGIRHVRVTEERTVAGHGRVIAVGVSGASGGGLTQPWNGNSGAAEPHGQTRTIRSENGCLPLRGIKHFYDKMFCCILRAGTVRRSPTAYGFAGKRRCPGVIGPMIGQAIANPRERYVPPTGRRQRADGGSGRAIASECVLDRRSESPARRASAAANASVVRENPGRHPPPIALPLCGERFWAGLVFRYARSIHGSVRRAGVQASSPQSSIARCLAIHPNSGQVVCAPAGQIEPLPEALQTLLAGMARRRVGAEGGTRA